MIFSVSYDYVTNLWHVTIMYVSQNKLLIDCNTWNLDDLTVI